MWVREPFARVFFYPVGDLRAGITPKQPADFGAVPELQDAFDDQRRGVLRVEAFEFVFLKKWGERSWNGLFHRADATPRLDYTFFIALFARGLTVDGGQLIVDDGQ